MRISETLPEAEKYTLRPPCSKMRRTNALPTETAMRKYIDCREFPSEMNCTVALSASSEQELLDAAVQHAVTVHGHKDTPEFRQQIKQAFRDGTPPL